MNFHQKDKYEYYIIVIHLAILNIQIVLTEALSL
jgi:hypothetical protein